MIIIGLFRASEDDLRESEAALKEINRPEGLGTRTGTDYYQVVRRDECK